MKYCVIDAFAENMFEGNPAAVCFYDDDLSDDLMQKIAAENNLSETAYVKKLSNGNYSLRWFTPKSEIDLCGHATLAAAFAISKFKDVTGNKIVFETRGGLLPVKVDGDFYTLDLPAYDLREMPISKNISELSENKILNAFMGRDLVLVLEDSRAVKNFVPNLAKIEALDGLLLHITAPFSNGYDCISRSFAPKLNVPEDPVCGSGHCHIVPIWSKALDKCNIKAFQASKRSGTLYCTFENNRVLMSGKCVLFSTGEIQI